MLNLLAIAASKAVGSRFSTVTSSVTRLFAIDALHLNAVHLSFDFLAKPSGMAKLFNSQAISANPSVSYDLLEGGKIPTVAVGAFWNIAVHRKTSIFQTLHVLLRRSRPTLGGSATLWFWAEVIADLICAIQFALEVD